MTDRPLKEIHAAEPDARKMLHMISQFGISQAIFVAAQLGVADLLQDGPCTVEGLAQATGTQPLALERLLGCLCCVGIFAQDTHRRFHLTPLATYLQADSPVSFRSLAIMMGQNWYQLPWHHLLHCVQTGEDAFTQLYTSGIFDYLKAHGEASKIFNAAMNDLAIYRYRAVSEAYDFSTKGCVVDIGGGQGTLLKYILEAHPHLRGVLFDLPHVLAQAAETLSSTAIADRCTYVGGDFFVDIPHGGDVYILSKIIHDWDEQDALHILRTCRRAMAEESVLLLIEIVLGTDATSWYENFVDIEMMVMVGGRERNEAAYRGLLAGADLHLQRILATPASSIQIIEAVPLTSR